MVSVEQHSIVMTFKDWSKSLGMKAVEGVILGGGGFILVALAKNQPITELTGSTPLVQFMKSTIPVWWLLVAIALSVLASTGWFWLRAGDSRSIPGLVHFRPRFNGFDYEPSMNSQDLLIVLNDGKSWIANHKEALERRVLERGQKVRVMVIHPRSDFISTLVRKSNRTALEEDTHLYQTFRRLEDLKLARPELVELRGHFLFNPYILHLSESVAVVHPFFLLERGELPLYVFENNSASKGLYEQYKADC